jgi:hypothetical protein
MSDTPETDAALKESSKWRKPLISDTTMQGYGFKK